MKKKFLIIAVSIVVFWGIFWMRNCPKNIFCFFVPKPDVKKILKKPLKDILDVTGEILAEEYVIKNNVTGRFFPAQRALSENDFVQDREVLGFIDPKEWKIKKEEGEACVKIAEVQCDVAKHDLENRKKNFYRMENLLRIEVVSQTQKEIAEKEYFRAKENVKNAEAHIINAKNSLLRIERELHESQIIAPFSGIIQKKHVSDFETLAPNASLFTLVRIKPLVIKIALSETYRPYIKEKTGTEIFAKNSQPIISSISKIYPIDPVRHTFFAEILIVEPEKFFMPGMQVQARIFLEKPMAR